MQLEKSLFLKKSLSLISVIGLAVFGGVAVSPAQAHDYYHHPNSDQAQELDQAQEYLRVQKLRRVQALRRVQDHHSLREFQRSQEVYLNLPD